ncbi:MAG: S24 family peptidase [bacterium]|nr:S24 family peptidase [bacterium]
MHIIQEKILKLIDRENISGLPLRDIAVKIGETGSPQKIKHHLDQLASKGFIKIDKRAGKIERIKSGLKKGSNFISLPILGSANCGEAVFFADNHVEGYLKVTKSILGDLVDKVKYLFVLRAVGQSMNQANTVGGAIEDGDFVIVDGTKKIPSNEDYVVSIIDGVANIKKIYIDNKNQQFILISESNQDLPPIYIHKDDLDNYLIAGKVVKVMKQPDELSSFMNAAAEDTLKYLGDMSKEEVEYYNSL